VASENNFLRSWTHELYLWYSEVPDLDPNSYTDPLQYFDLLKTPAKTPSGRDKDQFHFTYDTDDWIALSQSGVSAGYGVQWIMLATTPPRRIVVAYTEPNSPASAQNVSRGMEVLSIDGADAINGGTQAIVDRLNAGLAPASAGESHTFVFRQLDGTQRTITMTSANVTSEPVQNVRTIDTQLGRVGYLLFNDHIATSEAALAAAVSTLRTAAVQDLILDIRYNGGGYLDIASAMGYMIAGSRTAGRTFERLIFNSKHTSTNPVTGEPLQPTPFWSVGGFGTTQGASLPTLDLPRVYVLTGGQTCSASESIINGLRGVGVDVYQFGTATCGKPYGFYAQDNCGTTYFSIQFQGVNDVGFGDYADGFSPRANAGLVGAEVPGCVIADDFERALGDADEARLSAALAFRAAGNSAAACPPAGQLGVMGLAKTGESPAPVEGLMLRSPARENRILRDML
jgi:carboxyl-terminal processing protease